MLSSKLETNRPLDHHQHHLSFVLVMMNLLGIINRRHQLHPKLIRIRHGDKGEGTDENRESLPNQGKGFNF